MDLGSEHRLATYGTLRPGESNHRQLDALAGEWASGTVQGHRYESGWREWIGYPGVVLDADAGPVEVDLFTSTDLPDHWERLDHFEGVADHRVIVDVTLEDGATVAATIYEVLPEEN